MNDNPHKVNLGSCRACLHKRWPQFKDRYEQLKTTWCTDNRQCDHASTHGSCRGHFEAFLREGMDHPIAESARSAGITPAFDADDDLIKSGIIQLVDERGVDIRDKSAHRQVLVKDGCGCVIESGPYQITIPAGWNGRGAITHMAVWKLNEAPRECDKCKPSRTKRMF